MWKTSFQVSIRESIGNPNPKTNMVNNKRKVLENLYIEPSHKNGNKTNSFIRPLIINYFTNLCVEGICSICKVCLFCLEFLQDDPTFIIYLLDLYFIRQPSCLLFVNS